MASLSLFTFTFFTINFGESYLVPRQRRPACAGGFAVQGGEGVGEKIWVLGGDGFGTERARLAQGGSSAERASLAQVKNLQNFHLRRIRYFWVQNSKNPDPRKEKIFLGSNSPTCPAY